MSQSDEYVLIGVAWPYANGPLHLGHVAGALLPADIFARYQRMRGRKVLMVSGTDEHGTPITVEARKRGISPKELVDKYHEIIKGEIEALEIKFDLFTRTTTENHVEFVKKFIRRLYERGYVYEREMEIPHCKNCGSYLPDRYIEGTCPYCGYPEARGDQCDNCGALLEPKMLINPKCKICGSTEIEFVNRKHLFFALSKLQEPLMKWLEGKKWWRPNVINHTMNWVKKGLKDRAITRDIEWGVEVPFPGYEDKRIYVWFDALLGYISASIEYSKRKGDPDYWKNFWKNEKAKTYFFMGKDNIPFHTIIFPAMLMAHGEYVLPYDVPANEYLLLKGEKFSTSRGIAFWVSDFLKEFDVESIRYYLSATMPETRDSSISMYDFIRKNNDELVANIGNFIHRVLYFTYTRFSEVPEPGELSERDKEVLEEIRRIYFEVEELFEKCKLRAALLKASELAHLGNKYLDEMEPWKTIKEDVERTKTTMYVALRIVKALIFALHPFLPSSTQKAWEYMGNDGDLEEMGWEEGLKEIKPGVKLRKPKPLYKVIEEEKYMEREGPASYLDLRVGLVEKAEDHPNADKLYVLEVNLGEERRTIVTGLKDWYSKEELEGRKLVIVANMKPAKFRGIKSEGMLLAAEEGGEVSLLVPEGDPGERVYFEGVSVKPKAKVTVEDIKKAEMYVDDQGRIRSKSTFDALMRTSKGYVKVDKPMRPGAPVH